MDANRYRLQNNTSANSRREAALNNALNCSRSLFLPVATSMYSRFTCQPWLAANPRSWSSWFWLSCFSVEMREYNCK
jgi:hypothetical protein